MSVYLNIVDLIVGLPRRACSFLSSCWPVISIFTFKSMPIWFATGVTPANHLGIFYWANHIWCWENITKPWDTFWRLQGVLVSDGDFSILFFSWSWLTVGHMASQWYGKYCTYSYENNKKYRINTVADPGTPLFLDQNEAWRAEKFFWETPPSYLRV